MHLERLVVFDFDNTLFKSPLPPKNHTGGWWGSVASLSPPLVPADPSSDWWNAKVLAAAREAIADPSTYAVMMTGRIPKFERRVRDLLASQRLYFDEAHFNGSGPTETYKQNLIRKLVETTNCSRVEIWEDRKNHLDGFCQMVTLELGLECIPHLVPHVESPA